MVPNARAEGNTQISIGAGNYGSSSALAFGAFHYLNDNVLLNAGISKASGSEKFASRAGLTIGW
jgi:autotransporter adhesin